MSKNRLFYLLLFVCLVGLTMLAFYPSLEKGNAVSAASVQIRVPSKSQETQDTAELCPFTAEQIQSLHSIYIKAINLHMLATDNGPIGYDGGLPALGECRFSNVQP